MNAQYIISRIKYSAILLFAGGLAFSIACANIGIVLLLIAVLCEYIFLNKKFVWKKTPLELSLSAWILLYIISGLLGKQPVYSLSRFNAELLCISFYVYLYGLNKEEAYRSLKIFGVCTAVTALFGLIQYAIGIDMDMQGNLINVPAWLKAVPEQILHELTLKQGRLMSTRSHPITYAEAAFFGLIVMLTFIIIEKHIIKRIMWIAASLVTVFAVMLSYSRGAWLAIAAGIPVLLIVKKKKRIRVRYIAVAAACIAVIVFLSPQIRSRVLSLDIGSKESNKVRISLWKTGFDIIRDYPLLGIGPHSLKFVYDQYKNPDIPDKRIWSELHNQYLQVAAERGMIGLGVYLWLLVSMGMMLYYAWKHQIWSLKGQMAAAGLACYVGFLVMCLTENAFYDSEINLIVWFILGTVGYGNE